MSDPSTPDPSNWRDDPAWPDVDVVMPIRNEAPHLRAAIEAIRAQHYPGNVRIILGVGPSDDDTVALAQQFAQRYPDLIAVDNPSGRTPTALNLAIRHGTAPVIVRVDGHSQLSDGYITRAVSTLRRTSAANVGGMQIPVPTTPFHEAVAIATTSWLGTGGAAYRTGGAEGPVDTVYLGVFDRAAVEAVGLFDDRLIRNQDYELNIRLRNSGRLVVFDPRLSVGYTPRSTWRALIRQYYEYGRWKAEVLRLHPGSWKIRQLLAPAGVIGVLVGLLVGSRWRPALVGPLAYAAAVAAVASRSDSRRLTTAAVISMIHASWTAGIVHGAITRRRA